MTVPSEFIIFDRRVLATPANVDGKFNCRYKKNEASMTVSLATGESEVEVLKHYYS